MATALVTGGTGFLGSHIARVLVAAGHTVRILRRERSPLSLLEGLAVEHAIGDIMDVASLDRAMQGCDWVFHVAATSDYWRNSRVKLYQINVMGARNVFERALAHSVDRVIFTSSGAAVGVTGDNRPADESIPFNLPPNDFAYGHSKWLAEAEAWRAAKKGLDVVAVNPAVVFGPGDLNQISGSAVIEQAKGIVAVYPSGGVTVVDVRDVAQAHLAAAERGRTGERYLIGKEDMSHKALLDLSAEILGVPAPQFAVPNAVVPAVAAVAALANQLGITLPLNADQIKLSARQVFFDCRKAWAAFGEPRITVRESLQATVDWYAAHGMLTLKR